MMRACPHCKTPYTTSIEFCGIDGTRLVESDTDPLIGATIDRYRVVERIGDGGMAAVYRAVHTVIDRQCALKVLFGELASDKSFAQRFRHEAQTASRIKHDNVVEVLDFGTTPEGASFLLMELLEGKTLGAAIRDKGTIEPKRAAWIAREIAAGLAAAHAIGFVHRDLKPANIMLVEENGVERAKILDFGLVSSKKEDGAHLTHTGQTLGTPYYMAPEQIEGGNVTPRTDIYALGIIVHEMLSGARPFVGSLSEILLKHASEPPPPLPAAGGLEELVDWMLEKSPSRRPASAVVVVREIEKLALLPEHAPNLVLPAVPVEAPASPETRAEGRVPVRIDAPPPPVSTSVSVATSMSNNDRESSASVLFPPSVPSLSASSSSSSPPEGESTARTETALHMPRPTPPPIIEATVTSRPEMQQATRVDTTIAAPTAAGGLPLPLVGVAVIIAVALVVFGVDRVRSFVQPLQGAVEDVGEKVEAQAKNVAGAAPNVVIAPPPVIPPEKIIDEARPVAPDAKILARLDTELANGLRKRGLSRADLGGLVGVTTLLRRYEGARDGTDAERLYAAHAALVSEIARAPLSKRVVDNAIARVASLLRDKNKVLGSKSQVTYRRRLKDVQADAKKQRSEAERSRIMLSVADLEGDITRAAKSR